MSHQRGFTLIELLLVVIVLMIFMASAVFYMSPALKKVKLEEGAARVESMFKFASAEATQTGKRVLVRFISTNDLAGNAIFWPRVAVESDPIGSPGVFTDLSEVSWLDSGISDLVSVTSVVRADEDSEIYAESSTNAATLSTSEGESDGIVFQDRGGYSAILGDVRDGTNAEYQIEESADEVDSAEGIVADSDETAKSILFYPDGSSETVEVWLVSHDEDDTRKAVVRLNGITGLVEREVLNTSDEAGEVEQEEDDLQKEELLEDEAEETINQQPIQQQTVDTDHSRTNREEKVP